MNRLAIFDCDGTLVDSGATIHAALAETFAPAWLGAPAAQNFAAGDRAQPDRSHGGARAGCFGQRCPRSPRIISSRSRGCAARAGWRSRCSTACSTCSTRSRPTGGCSRSRPASRTAGSTIASRSRSPRPFRLAADGRPPSLKAAPFNGRASDRRRGRHAGNDDRRRRYQLRHGDGGGRGRDGDRRGWGYHDAAELIGAGAAAVADGRASSSLCSEPRRWMTTPMRANGCSPNRRCGSAGLAIFFVGRGDRLHRLVCARAAGRGSERSSRSWA